MSDGSTKAGMYTYNADVVSSVGLSSAGMYTYNADTLSSVGLSSVGMYTYNADAVTMRAVRCRTQFASSSGSVLLDALHPPNVNTCVDTEYSFCMLMSVCGVSEISQADGIFLPQHTLNFVQGAAWPRIDDPLPTLKMT